MKILLIILLFTFSSLAQNKEFALAADTSTGNAHQLAPAEEKILAEAEAGRPFCFIGMKTEAGEYYLLVYSGQNEFQIEENYQEPFVVNVFGVLSKFANSNIKVKRSEVGKLKIEVISVKIPLLDFEFLLSVSSLSINYGKLKSNASPANLSALDSFKKSIMASSNKDFPHSYGNWTAAPDPVYYEDKRVHVNSYSRDDGTYVRSHTRRMPRKRLF